MNGVTFSPHPRDEPILRDLFSRSLEGRNATTAEMEPAAQQQQATEEDIRIRELRREFSSDPKKKPLMNNLQQLFREWQKKTMSRLAEHEQGGNHQNQAAWRSEENIARLKRLKKHWHQERGQETHPDGQPTSSSPSTAWWRRMSLRRGVQPTPQEDLELPELSRNSSTNDKLDPYYGLNAHAMYFKKTEAECATTWTGYRSTHKKLSGVFPNQKMALREILDSTEDNPLMEACPEDTIRYFHIPTNNMAWIETAIARYYAERPECIDDPKSARSVRKTKRLLAREFWRGQLHGTSTVGDRNQPGGSIMHARHMRSKCLVIPRVTQKGEATESASPISPTTSAPSRQSRINSFSLRHPCPGKNIAIFLPYLHWEMSNRRAMVARLINEIMGRDEPKMTVSRLTDMVKNKRGRTRRVNDQNIKATIGRYLMTVARIAEEMECYRDERLLREHIRKNPPLHIRRTLDQYYFTTIDDTSQRDQDQVVYRGTKEKPGPQTGRTRMIMVDQLWLWILDDNTIITSFPRRWGRNKPDASGVHKSLRVRFEAGLDEVQSIHHLALIIMDQCSRVFFDRTKSLDERPEVMDLFAEALGRVTERTAMAYESFWSQLKLYSSKMQLPEADAKTSYAKCLDINPEGTLFKEAQDIVEELKIMKHIFAEQLKVIMDFKRHLTNPHGKRRTIRHREATSSSDTSSDTQQEDWPSAGDTSQASNHPFEESLYEAEVLVELIESREAEIQDLEDSALRTCQQLEGLLQLKQQQASLVEAKAAKDRADESVKQGRAIMAFTMVTIFFLPLGFFAGFFGMNNREATNSNWMSLDEQILYMFCLSAFVITLSVAIAFSHTTIVGRLFRIVFPRRNLKRRLLAERKKRDGMQATPTSQGEA